jgi:hypothetical protein
LLGFASITESPTAPKTGRMAIGPVPLLLKVPADASKTSYCKKRQTKKRKKKNSKKKKHSHEIKHKQKTKTARVNTYRGNLGTSTISTSIK